MAEHEWGTHDTRSNTFWDCCVPRCLPLALVTLSLFSSLSPVFSCFPEHQTDTLAIMLRPALNNGVVDGISSALQGHFEMCSSLQSGLRSWIKTETSLRIVEEDSGISPSSCLFLINAWQWRQWSPLRTVRLCALRTINFETDIMWSTSDEVELTPTCLYTRYSFFKAKRKTSGYLSGIKLLP